MAEFVYGIRKSDGKIISIYDILDNQIGLKCDCKCPTCHVDLEACSLHGKVNRYFRHYSDKSSGGGGGGGCDAYSTNESALHLMAKEIIKEERIIFFPSKTISIEETALYNLPISVKEKITQEYEYQKPEGLECFLVELEKRLPGFQPDVFVKTSRGEVLIEIVVTNDIKRKKKERIKEYNLPTLKIDLSDFVEEPISRSELREIIIGNTELKTWAHYPISTDTLKSAQKYYENLPFIQQYFEEVEKKRKLAQLEAEKCRYREKKLCLLLEPENYNAELERLRNDDAFISYAQKEFVFFKDHQKKPFFIDILITGEMVFQCDRRIWQGQIFDRYIYKRKEDAATFNVLSIFDNLKEDHKIPIEFDLTYKINVQKHFKQDFWFRFEVIETYIKYLELLGFVESKHSGNRYKQKEWKVVKARHTIEPPDQNAKEHLLNALKKVNRRSPDIDLLISSELREFYIERARRIEKEKQEAEKEKQKALRRKQREMKEAQLAKKRQEFQQKISDFDFDQSAIRPYDEAGYRVAKCTSCNRILRANRIKADFPNINKGICYDCLRKQKKFDTE